MSTKIQRLNMYFRLLKIEANDLQSATGIGLRVCRRILKGESMPNYETLEKIKEAYPFIDITYVITG